MLKQVNTLRTPCLATGCETRLRARPRDMNHDGQTSSKIEFFVGIHDI